MNRRVSRLVMATLAIALSATSAVADKRVALVIGNSAYRNVTPLDNPKNDARLMGDTLRELGFTLVGGGAQFDLDKAKFDTLIQDFGRSLMGADVALFYYAGHGFQVRGVNYLVPVSANLTREAEIDFQMVDVNLVLRQMEGGTKFNLVVLDACRNNPFAGRGIRSVNGGLAQMRAPEGTLISFATEPGAVALDGADGNSPYTKALAQTIRTRGLGIFDAINRVGLEVKRTTGGAQQPWFSSSPIDGNFFFASAPTTSAPKVAPPSRLALVLVADDPAKASGPPLQVYGNAGATHRIERDITFPGDIERFDVILDDRRVPAINISLAPAALARINAGAGVVGREIALVLDGRTVLSAARLRDPLSANLMLSGNFSMAEIKRLTDAVAANP